MELAQFLEQSDRGPVIHLALLDIDHFKQFNDRFGHLVGDRVLSLVGKQLSAATRVGVSVYRYGGEEFALIFWRRHRPAGAPTWPKPCASPSNIWCSRTVAPASG